jgi:ELWxxDGT repeat protein
VDLNEGPDSSGAKFLFAMNGSIYFEGSDGNDTDINPNHHSYSLFKTDGTAEGTVLVKDINPTEVASSEARIDLVTQLGNEYLFLANDGVNGSQLWKSDGTTDGTILVKSLYDAGANVRTMTVFNDKLFIAEANTGLWESDGTAEGTKLVKAFDYTLDLQAIDNGLIVSAREDASNSKGYWLSNGTNLGTELFHNRGDNNLWLGTKVGNGTMFYEYNGVGTYHYYTDGTSEGTKILETPNGLNFLYSDF